MKSMHFQNRHLPQVCKAFALILLLSSCTQTPVEEEEKGTIQSVKLASVKSALEQVNLRFPAEVAAVKTLDASFEVSGRLQEANLITGSVVKKGEVLAQLEPTPFLQRLQEVDARFKQAQRDLTRIEATFKKGLAPQATFDNAKTALEIATINLSKAKQDMSYTTLHAPFDAQISERLVENGSYVSAGAIIARLQDVSRLYFTFNVPERVLSDYKEGASVTASATMIAGSQKTFPLEYVEHATQPDPITQTYRVIFAASSVKGNLTPGARAIVDVSLGYQPHDNALMVPFTAIQGSDVEGFGVWKYNTKTHQVEKVAVKVLDIEHEHALIAGDLSLDALVVAAGVSKMREGMQVKPYQPER
ncbi:MAG: efflux RND transporter periplasmic adaptor subunit [Pseudomonadota bacterium]